MKCMTNHIFFCLIVLVISVTTIAQPIKPQRIFSHDANFAYKYLYTAEFNPDGKYLITGGSNGVMLWSMNTGDLLHHYKIPDTFCLDITSDGMKVIAGTWWGMVYVLNTDTGKIINEFKAHEDVEISAYDWGSEVHSLDISTNDKLLITNGSDSCAKIWDYENNILLHSINKVFWADIVSFFNDNERFIIGRTIWRFSKSENITEFVTEIKDSSFFITNFSSDAIFSPDGLFMYGRVGFNKIGILDLSTYNVQYIEFDYYKLPIRISSCDFSPNGELILIASDDGLRSESVDCWHILKKKIIFNMNNKNYPITSFPVRFSPDGTKFITGGPDATVLLWDLNEVINAQSSVDYFENYDE